MIYRNSEGKWCLVVGGDRFFTKNFTVHKFDTYEDAIKARYSHINEETK